MAAAICATERAGGERGPGRCLPGTVLGLLPVLGPIRPAGTRPRGAAVGRRCPNPARGWERSEVKALGFVLPGVTAGPWPHFSTGMLPGTRRARGLVASAAGARSLVPPRFGLSRSLFHCFLAVF